MEKKIANLIENTIHQLGFDLIKVNIHGSKPKILQILIDRQDGQKVGINDCSFVSRNISVLLDVEDYIKDKYYLEVASAGIERPLVKIGDFERFKSSEIKVILKNSYNNKSKYKGKIEAVEGSSIILQCKEEKVELDYNNIKSANLVLTDEMFNSLLAKTKKNKLGEKNDQSEK